MTSRERETDARETVKIDQDVINWDVLDRIWEERYVEDYGHLFNKN